MRIVWLMPVAYIAGIEGFGWFLPYLAFVGLIVGLAGALKKLPKAQIHVPEAAPAFPLELEPALA